MKTLLFAAALIIAATATAQTHCTRAKIFVAEMNTTMSLQRTGAPLGGITPTAGP